MLGAMSYYIVEVEHEPGQSAEPRMVVGWHTITKWHTTIGPFPTAADAWTFIDNWAIGLPGAEGSSVSAHVVGPDTCDVTPAQYVRESHDLYHYPELPRPYCPHCHVLYHYPELPHPDCPHCERWGRMLRA